MNRSLAPNCRSGFTIVELIVSITVVAILVTVTVVAYNGFQSRSRNAARISTATQMVELLKLYREANDGFPPSPTSSPNYGLCLSTDNVCTNFAGEVVTTSNTAFLNELKKYGSLPPKIDKGPQSTHYGIYFDTYNVRLLNGQPTPGVVIYWLEGDNQKCMLNNIVDVTSSPPYPGNQLMTLTTNGYTSTGAGRTTCFAAVL